MPLVGKILGYNIFFSSREGYPLEPIHVHVDKKPSSNSPKFWLMKDGSIKIARKGFLKDKELVIIIKCLKVQYAQILDAWKKHFSLDKVKFYEESQTKSNSR